MDALLHCERPKLSKASDEFEHPRLHRETTYIPASKLSVLWAAAQRPYDPEWATLIAENFDPNLLEDVIVTQPNEDGISHIIEGQHRVAAIVMLWGNDELVPCRIIADSNPATAAHIWTQINSGKKKARPVDRFKVRVTSEHDGEASLITRILADHRLGIGQKAIGKVAAVSALTSVYRLKAHKDQCCGEILDHALCAMTAIWGTKNPEAYCATLINSFGLFMRVYWGKVDLDRLVATVKRRFANPDELIAVGRNNRERTLARGICRELVCCFNYKRTGGVRLSLEDI